MPFAHARTTPCDAGIRTSMIVRMLWTVPPSTVQKGLFSLVDLAPIVLDVVGHELESAQGKGGPRCYAI